MVFIVARKCLALLSEFEDFESACLQFKSITIVKDVDDDFEFILAMHKQENRLQHLQMISDVERGMKLNSFLQFQGFFILKMRL